MNVRSENARKIFIAVALLMLVFACEHGIKGIHSFIQYFSTHQMPTTTMDGVRNFFDLLLAIAWPLLVTCAYFAIAVSLRRIIMAWPTDDDTIMRQFAPRAVILVGILFFINTATMAFYTYGSIIAEIAGTSRFVASHQLGLSAMDTISQVGMQFTNFFSCAINAAISWLLIREGRAQLALDRAAPPEPTPAA